MHSTDAALTAASVTNIAPDLECPGDNADHVHGLLLDVGWLQLYTY